MKRLLWHQNRKQRDARTGKKRRRRGRRLLVTGAAAGAGFTYLFDPDQGRRRRALLRDKVEHARHILGDTSDVVVRDSRNRGSGMLAEAQRLLQRQEPGEGRIEHSDIPALQGEGQISGPRPELLQQHWAPAPRALAGALGGTLLTYGLTRRGVVGLGIAGGGGTLLARAVTNQPVRELSGIGVGPDAVRVDKTIRINAPVEEVWPLWEDYESFPTFMSHVREVRPLGDGWSHWTVDGPLGKPVEWNAELIDLQPNERLAWRSAPGAPVQHAGEVALEPAGDGSSQVHVRMSYSPALGVAGHALARALGADAETQLDDDLLRMKTMVETGKPPPDAARA